MSMERTLGIDLDLEPERYELHEAPRVPWPLVDRRAFLKALGGGLAVLCLLREGDAQESGRGRRRETGGELPEGLGAWLHIDQEGKVTAYTGKVEVGQNARTSLSQAVADELHLPVEAVDVVMGDTKRVPYDRGTFGSRTTPTMVPQLRRAAATARNRLLELAAREFEAEPEALTVAGGRIEHPKTGRSLSFGELARRLDLVEAIDEDEPITPAGEWTVAGRSTPKVNGRDFVTGQHRFTTDLSWLGMQRGKVLRPPVYGATLAALDATGVEALPGVVVVRDGDFVGVAAPDEPTAERALKALRAEWKGPDGESLSDRNVFDAFSEEWSSSDRQRESAAVKRALEAADVRLEARYDVAYIAHVPLEPRAAVAEWDGDELTVWTGTQRPFGVRGELAAAFRIPEERVRVLMPDTGSGYGGKHTGEAAIEAARLARAARRPVKVVWTREEEFTWAYFRPAGRIEVKAGAAQDGTLRAWEFHNLNSGSAGIETPYAVAERLVAYHPVTSPLRQGSYRALASTANHFARESAMDELARQLKMDPLEFRLKNRRDDRLRAVFEAAAERFGWGQGKPVPNRGVGLAGGTEKGGFVATCAEVAIGEESRGRREVRIERVVTAFECGAVINPEHLKNQVEGCLVMGLGGALFEAIRFAEGTIRNGRLSRYRVPRFDDLPQIEVVLLDRPDLPSAGAGEAPIVGIAPAIANAIFDAVGVRLRSLPLVPDGLRV